MYSNSVIIHREKVLYVSNESCLQSRSVPLSTSPSTLNTFLSSNFPDAISQAATYQVCLSHCARHPNAAFGASESDGLGSAYVMVPTIFEKLASEIWLQSCKVTSKLKT